MEDLVLALLPWGDRFFQGHSSGFHGMGGVGKTTLAKALYNKLVSQFEHRSFISNVREASMQPNGLVFLQRKLLGDLSLGRHLA
ncbi:disease resistance protein TAO1-like protein isoform X2 [Cinnamomum micranthum f. kanehirae]|uniref:Disease resistance protein TAO1-like protein isoform X2 n=1 Tax=Cinnamomum micranthum f. kanehirae TaxID=337451 RepID=A0A443PPB2_9MAGN|nr:disease resistance protein TAO1-like protein isoform X2 [Cinnamomum micranthum f. kanehirae]